MIEINNQIKALGIERWTQLLKEKYRQAAKQHAQTAKQVYPTNKNSGAAAEI